MSYRVWFLVLAILSFLPARTAFASSVLLHSLGASQKEITATATVFAPKETVPSLYSLGSSTALPASVQKQALDLWLLLDSSGLCLRNKAEQQLATWITKMRGELPSQSRVSLLTFHRGALTVIATQQAIGDLPLNKLRCQAGAVSSEPEKALAYVTDTEVPAGLTRVVWVMSSGNVAVSRKQLQSFRETQTELAFFLYHPVVYKALTPLFDSMRSALGESLFYSGVISSDQTDLPARTYSLRAERPQGKNLIALSLVAQIKEGDNTAKSAVVSLALPSAGKPGILQTVIPFVLGALAAVLFLYGIFRLVRYYRPRYCSSCQHRLRFADASCPFCFEKDGAYLVSENPVKAIAAVAPLVTPLTASRTRVGTQRRSAVRLLRHPREKRQVFFQIDREKGSFRLKPGTSVVFINEIPVASHRFLASGDSIRVQGTQMKFIKTRSSHV